MSDEIQTNPLFIRLLQIESATIKLHKCADEINKAASQALKAALEEERKKEQTKKIMLEPPSPIGNQDQETQLMVCSPEMSEIPEDKRTPSKVILCPMSPIETDMAQFTGVGWDQTDMAQFTGVGWDETDNARIDKERNHHFVVLREGQISTFLCNHCPKSFKMIHHVRRHVEIHMDFLIPCEYCGKRCNTRDAMRKHKKRHHKFWLSKN